MADSRSVPTGKYFLGVNTGPHDAAAAIVRDGEIVAMVEQERISQHKHAFEDSPALAIAACLEHAGVGLESISEIAVGWDVPLLVQVEGAHTFDEREFIDWLLAGIPRSNEPVLRFVDHHLAHAASAFYTSGMEDAAVIVADGRGEMNATTIAIGGSSGIETIKTWGSRFSLGHYYGWASEWAGLGLWGTGKFMGLAAYGEPTQRVPLAGAPDGYEMQATPPSSTGARHHFALHRRALRQWFRENNYPYSEGQPKDVMAYADFAASIQHSLEQALLGLAGFARRETGLSRLVFAGGVALNCSANGVLLASGIFDEVWIPPFPHDAGVAVGAAMISARASGETGVSTRLASAFLAPNPPPLTPELFESIAGIEVEQVSDAALPDTVAEAIAEGSVVGWFQGRAEVGQRALGARSILCDPRARRNLVRVNDIKGREPWRPLAPAILEDEFSRLIDGEAPVMSAFMLAALRVRESAAHRMPVAVHVDGTARPQSVDVSLGRYHSLVYAFAGITGVPALINTSFNIGGSPVVYSREDALRTFIASDLDLLVVDDYLIRRNSRPSPFAVSGLGDLRGLSFTPWRRTKASHLQDESPLIGEES